MSRSDAEVVEQVAAVVSVPREDPGDSFVLHAPLETLARAALLPLAEPGARAAVLDRINDVGEEYATWGAPYDHEPKRTVDVLADATGVLQKAVEIEDSEMADDAICYMTATMDTAELVAALAGPVLPATAAAAHGNILLYLLPRIAPRSDAAASMARTTVHELMRAPHHRLTWFENERPHHGDPEPELIRRLVQPALDDKPPNNFIHPIMSATERSGLATDLLGDLGGLTLTGARRALLRMAAHSMIQDAPNEAPYGWSHCLTMPQAALGVGNLTDHRSTAISVAATYVLGFRACLSTAPIDPKFVPEHVSESDVFQADPATAAAIAWHTEPAELSILWRRLASNAGAHRDAHLAKYTLACLDATRADPGAAALFRAAAAYLNAWWVRRDD